MNDETPLPGSVKANVSQEGLDGRLDEVALTEEEARHIAVFESGKAGIEGLVSLVPGGSLAMAVLKAAENSQNELRRLKMEKLLAAYFDRQDDFEDDIRRLHSLLEDQFGMALFVRLQRMMDENPPDGDLAGALGRVLKKIAFSDFRKLFDQHKFALGLIDQLSPQALVLIASATDWEAFQLRTASFSGGILNGDWSAEMTPQLKRLHELSDEETTRVRFVVGTLIRQGFIEAHQVGPMGAMGAKPTLTSIGATVKKYLT